MDAPLSHAQKPGSRSSHTFPIPSPIAHLPVRTGVHAYFRAVLEDGRNDVTGIAFVAANSWGEIYSYFILTGGESGHAHN